MPLFAIICRDKAGALPIRLATRDTHVAWLKQSEQLRMAGPLIEDGEMRGSLIIVETETLADAQAWAAEDPYKAAGLFEKTEVIEWKKVI